MGDENYTEIDLADVDKQTGEVSGARSRKGKEVKLRYNKNTKYLTITGWTTFEEDIVRNLRGLCVNYKHQLYGNNIRDGRPRDRRRWAGGRYRTICSLLLPD